MMDERMEEQASLHVLGALSPEEAYEFKQVLKADPELQAYVARLTAATGALAGAVPLAEPPPQLRAKILAQVAPRQKVVSLRESKPRFALALTWALAICLTVLCGLLSAQNSRLKQVLASQAGQISTLNQLAESLQSATNQLQQTVLALQATNRLATLRIAMLNSLLADEPKAVAVSLWDNAKQEGVFVVQNLKPLPADRDYQLWVLDNGTKPVDAGVFRVDETGGVRVDFKARQAVNVPARFAVTEEVRGGAAAPTVKNMVLASN